MGAEALPSIAATIPSLRLALVERVSRISALAGSLQAEADRFRF
jgi:hypothetical protein